jgi:hypothetical protein
MSKIRVLHNGQTRRMSLSQFADMLKGLPKTKRSRRARP